MITICKKCGAKNRTDARSTTMKPVCGRCGAELSAESAKSSDGPVVVTDETFAQDVLASPVPVLLDCWAPWCGPCRMLTPTLDALAAESGGKFRVAKLNVDENPGTSARFNISSIPNVLLFNRGKLVDQIVGLQPKAAYLQKLESLR